MRVAILADIHANLFAFDAALADVAEQGADHIAILGDFINCGPHPNEVIARMGEIAQPLTLIRGNHEDYVRKMRNGDAPAGWQSEQWSFTRWTRETLSEANLDFLDSLPEQATLDLPGCEPARLVHSAPDNGPEGIKPYLDSARLDDALAAIGESTLASGHTHVSYAIWRDGKLALNPGAISASFDGDWRAHYALLDWDGSGWQPQFRRVAFDRDALAADMESSGWLAAGGPLTRALRINILFGVKALDPFLRFARQLAEEANGGALPGDALPDDIWARAEREWHWDVSKMPLVY